MKHFTHKTYGVGTKAYLDALFSGLVPCKVTAIEDKRVTALVTEDHKGYRKGVRAFPRLAKYDGGKP